MGIEKVMASFVVTETFDFLGQEIVERSQNVAPPSRDGCCSNSSYSCQVAARAIARSHNRGDQLAVMVEGIGIAVVGLVAFHAADPLVGVSAPFPVIDDAGRLRRLLMAFDAAGRTRGNGDVRIGQAGFLPASRDFEGLHENQRTAGTESPAHR